MAIVQRAALAIVALALLGPATSGFAQGSAPVSIRLASLWQGVLAQRASRSGFGALLDSGVVERSAATASPDLVPRESLVPKPIRLLTGPEAVALGGRGDFLLLTTRPPAGPAAWTSVEIVPRTDRPEDVCLLAVGGEQTSTAQVLETLLVATAERAFVRLELSLPALIEGPGVPVVLAPFAWPAVRPNAARLFRGAHGVEFLLLRSAVETMVDASVTERGPADLVPLRAGEWRDGDRLVVRVTLSTLRARTPGIVLGWKDRLPLAPLGEGR